MSTDVILPPATIGILGGGQLASMLCEAGKRMGYRMRVLSEDAGDPAHRWADEDVVCDWQETAAGRGGRPWEEFLAGLSVLTNEFEQVPSELLRTVERAHPEIRVAPGSQVQRVCQDRREEKRLFEAGGFPHGPFAAVEHAGEAVAAYERLSEGGKRRVVAKTARGGYDGKGQMWLAHVGDAQRVWAELGEVPLLLEAGIEFVAEGSVIVARSGPGACVSFPMFGNTHRNGILFQTVMPAGFSAETEKQARTCAAGIAEKLGVVGLLAVEMFVLSDGRVLMNELAARPHNSGHVTLRAATRSQFELHIAAVCNLPLAAPEVLAPGVMTNLLGDLWAKREPAWAALFREPRGTLHLYGKEPRPGRKMGHMIHTAATTEGALAEADRVFAQLTRG